MTGMSDAAKMLQNQINLIDASLTLAVKGNKEISVNQRLIEIYLFGRKKKFRKDRWKESNEWDLFVPISQQLEIDIEKPIFIDNQQARTYGRFLTNNFCLIKAHVFDLAIESKDNELRLRPEYFHPTMIHGVYPSNTDLRVYIKNSEFDPRLLECEENFESEQEPLVS